MSVAPVQDLRSGYRGGLRGCGAPIGPGRLVEPHVHLPGRPAAHDRGGMPLAAATRVPHSRMLGLQSWESMATSIMHGPSWVIALAKAAVISPAVLAWRPRPLPSPLVQTFMRPA